MSQPNPSPAKPPALPAAHDPYAALRYRDFLLYMAGWIFNVIGGQITEVAVGWDLYNRTHDKMALAWVGLVSALPVIILALPAGQLADHFDRRRIVLLSQIVSTACSVALGFLSYWHGPLLAIYSVLMVMAVCRAVGWPARSAMLPSLVPSEVFHNAVNWNSNVMQVSSMVGPALGGLILVWSVPAAYGAAGFCALMFGILVIVLRPAAEIKKVRPPPTLKDLAAGVQFVWRTKIILATITLDLFAVLLGGATYLLPVFAQDILKVGSVGFGWMRAAPAIGALVMGILLAHLPPMKHAGRGMLWAVAGFGAATIIFGLSKNLWLSLAMLFLTGAFDNVSVIVRHTLVQALTPDAMRGRVSAVNSVFIGSSNELGGFESAWVAKMLGTVTSVVIGGIGTIVVVAACALIWPQVRRFGSLVDAKAEPMPEPQGYEVVPNAVEPIP